MDTNLDTKLRPTPSNLRAEMARYQIQAKEVALAMGMSTNRLYILLREEKPMRGMIPYNIAREINSIVGKDIFETPQ